MKNKKGFTLIELMGVIIIMGVIALIAFSSFVGISRRMKEQAYKNKVKLIETKAENYANETGLLDTNVATLVDKGFLEADNNNDEVLSPIDKSLMNCHMVKMENNDGVYYAEYQEEEVCDLSSLVRNADGLVLNATQVDSNTPYVGGEWTKENIELSLSFNKDIDVNNIDNIIWTIDGYEDEVLVNGNWSDVNKYNVETFVVFNNDVYVEVNTKDKLRFKGQINVKIDKEKPVSYQSDIKINEKDIYTNHLKNTSFKATDNEGSGIHGYYLGKNSNCESNQYYEYPSGEFNIDLHNGVYYMCVKDNVGNVSDRLSFEVEKVDTTDPTCHLSANSSGISISTNDGYSKNDSGVDEGRTYISDTSLSEGYKWADVYDKVGNHGTCSIDIEPLTDDTGYTIEQYTCNIDGISGYEPKTCSNSGSGFGHGAGSLTLYNKKVSTCRENRGSSSSGGSKDANELTTYSCTKKTKETCVQCRKTTTVRDASCGCEKVKWVEKKYWIGDVSGIKQCTAEIYKKSNRDDYRCTTSGTGEGTKITLEEKKCSSFKSCSKTQTYNGTSACAGVTGSNCLKKEGSVSYVLKEKETKTVGSKTCKDYKNCVTYPKTPDCNSSVAGQTLRRITKMQSMSFDSGSSYSFETSSSVAFSCKKESKFTCNKNNVGKSYVSGCEKVSSSSGGTCAGEGEPDYSKPIYSYNFDYSIYDSRSSYRLDTSTFSCDAGHVGYSFYTSDKNPPECPEGFDRIWGTDMCYLSY